MDVYMPIDNLTFVGEVDYDVGSFSWALWLGETELRQHEHMIKRMIRYLKGAKGGALIPVPGARVNHGVH